MTTTQNWSQNQTRKIWNCAGCLSKIGKLMSFAGLASSSLPYMLFLCRLKPSSSERLKEEKTQELFLTRTLFYNGKDSSESPRHI